MLLPFYSHKLFALTEEVWLAVLKLSTLFHFNSVRKLAIAQLSPLLDSPTDKTCAGRVQYVSTWILDGYIELAQSTKPITEAQCDVIGDRTAIKIYLHSLVGGLNQGWSFIARRDQKGSRSQLFERTSVNPRGRESSKDRRGG